MYKRRYFHVPPGMVNTEMLFTNLGVIRPRTTIIGFKVVSLDSSPRWHPAVNSMTRRRYTLKKQLFAL